VLRGRLVQPPQDLIGPDAQKPAFFDRGIRSVRLELLDDEHLALKTRGSWGQGFLGSDRFTGVLGVRPI